MITKTNEEIKEHWESFSQCYQQCMEQYTSIFFYSLFNILKAQKGKQILEVGCGTGLGIIHSNSFIEKDTKYYATDISENMVQISKNRILNLNNNNIFISIADNEQLKQFEDQQFDVYIANLSLQIVNDPIKMLQEAYRVLQSGGRAGFSVWGRQENTSLFTIYSSVLKKHNVQTPNIRTNFHLNDQKNLVQILKDQGFINIKSMYQQNPINMDNQQLIQMYHERNSQLFQQLTKNQIDLIEYDFLQTLENIKQKEEFLGFEALIIIGEKP